MSGASVSVIQNSHPRIARGYRRNGADLVKLSYMKSSKSCRPSGDTKQALIEVFYTRRSPGQSIGSLDVNPPCE